ncbi:hypothetical protein EV188_110157 [Actinomycetospora succinea]|uniref:Uncharacterized protein n=1 Tax=Actinomycetospora succinea TaxID=663603 RepID=A0A4R6USF9_9PSEU|nr:hypothetical protein [Actinomycetospora succinea]TDQ50160.1 hypothetical protein EV188_110157 [Actinomycetospora succinea]
MTTLISAAEAAEPAEEVVVPVPGTVDAATLSCRLHAVMADPTTHTVVVEAGERADDPDLARVLACARDTAASRGLEFVVR